MEKSISQSSGENAQSFNPDFSKNEDMYKMEPIEDSPFYIIEADGKFAIVIGNARLTEWYHTKGGALDYMDTGNFMVAVITYVTEYLRNKEEIKKYVEKNDQLNLGL